LGESQSRSKISQLIHFLDVQPTQKSQIQEALISDFKDLEDGVQHFCALGISGLEGIITRNKKDFRSSQIPVFEPWEVVSTQ
jgi:hypothetical protein